jgi:uncharacterized protein (UPF0548 family)
MFLARRPSDMTIARFLDESQHLPLSYGPVGVVEAGLPGGDLDEQVVVIGRGAADFERGRRALETWMQFDLGWVTIVPRTAPVTVGTVVAVLIRHLGFWSLNGARVLYHVGSGDTPRFGFAYGTLTSHAESGEELFEVSLDPATGEVNYRIRATSRPRAALARIGYPVARHLQARFRRDSARVMMRATSAASA